MAYSTSLLFASLLLLFGPVFSAPTAPSATIAAGVVVGTVTSLPSSTVKVNKFLGIPFAAPPTGNQRFAPPAPPKSWSKPYNATAFAPSCMQQFNYPALSRDFQIAAFDTPPPPAGESEDCLYINVYAPATSTKDKTVMFWIYGGALDFGSNSAVYYDGTSFAANQDVIVVQPNYRTNVFGFPMSPQLPLVQRNLGYLDQRLALRWVQKNIHAFGGDPAKVTIFGESAGAASVDELVTTMPNNPPFRAAIMESGQTSFYVYNNTNTASWDTLVAQLNCSGSSSAILACVRAANASTILSINEHLALAFRPVSDNVTQLEFPVAARAAGKIAHVPIMTGTNAQEGRIFAIGQNNVSEFLQATIPGLPASFYTTIESAYPQGSPGLESQYDIVSQIYTDFIFQCPAAQLANSSSTDAHIPTWRYYFNATFPNTQYPSLDLGVYHSSEIPIVYGTYPAAGATQTEAKLSTYMQTAWANFAKNPTQGPGFMKWPNVAVLGTPGMPLESNVTASALDARCALYSLIYTYTGM